MQVFSLHSFLSAILVFQHSRVLSLYISAEQQKLDLADSIKFAVDQSFGSSTTKRVGVDNESGNANRNPEISKTVTPATSSSPETSTSRKQAESVQTVQVIQVPVGDNLFSGLVQNVGTLNLNGVIMEAFKIAQVSLGLFAQQLAGSLATTLAVTTNSTNFVIPQ